MFRKSYNRALLRLRVETVTPLLIRAGDVGLAPTASDLCCVRTRHALHGRTVYIPGSSLKGVLRSAGEATLRGQSFKKSGLTGACDPLDHRSSCGGTIGRDRDVRSPEAHRRHCLACRLFGSLSMKGRAAVRDMFPWVEKGGETLGPGGDNHRKANDVEVRHGVSIDRILGSVKPGGLFDQELVPAGISFWGEIALENYQAWQLGLLARAFDELNDGFAQLGSSKSRGLGVARVEVAEIVHEQSGTAMSPAGVGVLAIKEDRDAYGLLPDTELPGAAREVRGLSVRFVAEGANSTAEWLEAGRNALGGLQ